jgi:preprotein translocase subunit YajC
LAGGGGVAGTVTEAAADHYTIKTGAGETYVVHFSVNTQILKQMIQHRNPGEGAEELGAGGHREQSGPQIIKPGEIKAGDAIAAMGEVDAASKSVGATHILLIDPERFKQMREQEANFGKTWLAGKVTAINEAKVTLLGGPDSTAHAFLVDENTTFRKHREPITLADVQVGDIVRVEGAVKDGIFLAASVSVMSMGPGGTPTVPRDAAAQPQSK